LKKDRLQRIASAAIRGVEKNQSGQGKMRCGKKTSVRVRLLNITVDTPGKILAMWGRFGGGFGGEKGALYLDFL